MPFSVALLDRAWSSLNSGLAGTLIPAGYVTRSRFTTFRVTATIGLLAYIACKGEKAVDPSVATTITASSSTTLTGTAGSQASPAPSILVKDQNGAPMAGATVNLLVLNGGGTVSSATVTTNASGVATAAWTLGGTVGANALNMWASTLTAITFTATATAGAAASLTKSAGDNQAGTAGVPVSVAPSVVVKDAGGNVKADVVVTFGVASGGGSVTGATATSNAVGIATVGSWILGTAGTNTLTASAPGVPTVTFTATAAPNPCLESTAHALGDTTNGALTTTDCLLSDGTFVDFFTTTIAQANAYLFKQSATFDTYLYLGAADGTTIAESDDESDANTNSAIKALLPPGDYVLGASSFDRAITGAYSVTSSTTTTDVAGCELVFVVKNISTNQSVDATDCEWTPAPNLSYADIYFIFLKAGQTVTISMSSSAVDSFLSLIRLTGGATVASNDNKDTSGTKDAQVVFTATAADYYAIFARTAALAQTGAYTLQIQ